MKSLYLKLLELLRDIPEVKFIDLNMGQLHEEVPPLAYPAILVSMNINSTETIHDVFQEVHASFSVTLVTLSEETHSLHEDEHINKGLEYLDLCEKIHEKLQGYEDSRYSAFTRRSQTTQLVRQGVNTTLINYETTWREDFATP